MTSPIRSLLWKEWHEQWWKLVFGCVLLAGFLAIGLRTRLLPDVAILILNMFIGAFLLPIFASMDVVAAEREQGSLDYLLSLPIRPWVSFMLKTAIGLLLCILPFVVAFAVAMLVAGEREVRIAITLGIFIRGIALGSLLFIWTLSLGIAQSTEARAALIGIAVVVIWVAIGLAGVSWDYAWNWGIIPYLGAVILTLGLFADWLISPEGRRLTRRHVDLSGLKIIVMCTILISLPMAVERIGGWHIAWGGLAASPLGLLDGIGDEHRGPLAHIIWTQICVALFLLCWAGYRYHRFGRTR